VAFCVFGCLLFIGFLCFCLCALFVVVRDGGFVLCRVTERYRVLLVVV